MEVRVLWLGWGMGLIECPYCERQVSEYTVVDGIELPTKVCPYYGRSPAGGERLDEKSVRQPETPAEQEITQADTRDGGGVANRQSSAIPSIASIAAVGSLSCAVRLHDDYPINQPRNLGFFRRWICWIREVDRLAAQEKIITPPPAQSPDPLSAPRYFLAAASRVFQ